MTRERARRRHGRSPRTATGAAVLVVAAVVTGCTDDPAPAPSGDAAEEVALEVSVRTCAGRLDGATRTEIESGAGDLLSAYVVDGFLGDYPREGFVRALDSFTGGAASSGARDLDVLTASTYDDASAVTATRLRADLDCLVPPEDGVVGATARVVFEFEAERDGSTEPFTLTGRMLLVDDGRGWSVFGYDVARDDLARLGGSG